MHEIKENIYQLEAIEYTSDLFDSIYKLPNGIIYNSYLIEDDLTMIIGGVSNRFKDSWLKQIERVIGNRPVDYFFVTSIQENQFGSVIALMEKYPNCTIVTTLKSIQTIEKIYGVDYSMRLLEVSDNYGFNLGKHQLVFMVMPNEQTPEAMFCYDKYTKCVFSGIAFGQFGVNEDIDEIRRYYAAIFMKYPSQVQSILRKMSYVEVEYICPSIGSCIYKEDVKKVTSSYENWSKFIPDYNGVAIVYSSINGNTRIASEKLLKALTEKGCKAVCIDASRIDFSYLLSAALAYSKLVIASPTYQGNIFPSISVYINELANRNAKNRIVGIIDYSVGGEIVVNAVKKTFENNPTFTYLNQNLYLNSRLNEIDTNEFISFVDELLK